MPDNDIPDNDFDGSDESPEIDMEIARELGVTEDELARQPRWKQLKMGKVAEKARESERKADAYRAALDEQRALNQQLMERMGTLEKNVGAPKAPEPEGLGKYTMQDLRSAKLNAQKWLHRAAVDPEDAEARQHATTATPEMLDSLDEEIRRRERQTDINGLKAELTQKEQAAASRTQLQKHLQDQYGNEVQDMNSDLMKLASAIFRKKAAAAGISNDTGGLTMLAIDEAYREIRGRDRDGRGSEVDRRRLAVEGQTRREVETHNVIAALKQRGDWKADSKANSIELDQWLGGQRQAGMLK